MGNALPLIIYIVLVKSKEDNYADSKNNSSQL
jgi:hypothetical protein